MLHSVDGTLSFRSARTPSIVFLVEIPGNVLQLCCLGNQILLLLDDGELYKRSRVTTSSPMGFCWQRVETPEQVVTMAQSPNNGSNQLWILTRTEKLFYRESDNQFWWQVAMPTAELQANKSSHWSISSLFSSTNNHYQNSQLTLAVTESRIFLAIAGSSVILTGQELIGILIFTLLQLSIYFRFIFLPNQRLRLDCSGQTEQHTELRPNVAHVVRRQIRHFLARRYQQSIVLLQSYTTAESARFACERRCSD